MRENLDFLKRAEKSLASGRVVSAKAEAETLLLHLGKTNRLDFFTGQKKLTGLQKKSIEKALKERVKGRPLSYILKTADFYGRSFLVSPDTLIPRPETELLVEEASALLSQIQTPNPQVLDLGTGSGCIAVSLTIERPDCRMTALDISLKALRVARKNIDRYAQGKQIKLVQGSIFEAFGAGHREFWDLIVSNPPYIPSDELGTLPREVQSEPRLALDGGQHGLSLIHQILDEAPSFLKSKGWLVLEIGEGQSQAIRRKVDSQRVYKKLRFIQDYAGIERIVVLQKS